MARANKGLRGSVFAAIAAILVCLGTTARAAEEPEIELFTVNDSIAGERYGDDLYTGTVGLGLEIGPYDFELVENMFTDRRENEIRFDETYLTVSRVGFKHHLVAAAKFEWRVQREVGLEFGGGGRLNDVKFDPLKPWISPAGPTWLLGFSLFEHVSFRYTINSYGSQDRHIHVFGPVRAASLHFSQGFELRS